MRGWFQTLGLVFPSTLTTNHKTHSCYQTSRILLPLHYPETTCRGQQSHKRHPDFPLAPPAPPARPQGAPSPAERCHLHSMSWVFSGNSSWWDMPGTILQRGVQEASEIDFREPHPAPLDEMEQQLYLDILPGPAAHFNHFHSQPCSFGYYSKLMTVGEIRNVDRPVNRERQRLALFFLHPDRSVQRPHHYLSATFS